MLNDYRTIHQPVVAPVSAAPSITDIGNPVAEAPNVIYARYRALLDTLVIFPFFRWIGVLVLLIAFFIRMTSLNGFYIVAYVAGIFLLNQLVLFLTPNFLPTARNNDQSSLPQFANDEFRPFDRRLKEFDFWLVCTKTLFISLAVTLFPCLDLPVYWPILLCYFCLLFFVTMRQQVHFMIKYRYVPFSYGKTRYGNEKTTGTLITS